MPPNLNVLTGRPKSLPLDAVDKYKYNYPHGLDLKPGSTLHDYIRDQIFSRALSSRTALSNRFSTWQDIDKTLTGYIWADEKEQRLKDDDPRKPISIVVPLSYSVLEVLLTYMVNAFLRPPFFHYEGFGSEDMLGAQLLEKVVDMQMQRSLAGLRLHTMFRDAFAYGFGVVTPVWTKEIGYRRKVSDAGFFSTIKQAFMKTGVREEREEYIAFEGNELENIDPYRYFPDVNYPIDQPQKGEYIGWLSSGNVMELLSRERVQSRQYFNARYLNHIDSRSSFGADESARDKESVGNNEGFTDQTHRVDTIYMAVNLIPNDWGMGSNKNPQKWMFGLSGDSILTSASPLNLDHNRFPGAVCAPNYDGHSAVPVSQLECIAGMQTFMNFLYNSHIANVRKAIHDMFLVDPAIVNVPDLQNPGPGKIIRTRPKAWGHGVKDALEQLQVVDVTSAHVREIGFITDVIHNTIGTVDIVRGNLRSNSADISATEFKGTQGAALSRLEKHATIAGMQAMSTLAYMVAKQTQQYMTQDTYVKIAGETEDQLRAVYGDEKRALVSPMDLLIDFDVIPHDGSLPDSGSPSDWLAALQIIGANPVLNAKFSTERIFMHWAKLGRAKNIEQFLRTPAEVNAQIMQDQKVLEQAKAGNLVPSGAA